MMFKSRKLKGGLIAALYLAAAINVAAGEKVKSDFSEKYHERIANLKFDHGYPTRVSAENLRDELEFQRATQAYIWALPVANMRAMQKEHARLMDGNTAYNKIAIYENRVKSHTLITTPNSDVIYGLAWLDMKDTGPLVMEVPSALQALIDDMYHDPLVGPKKKDGTEFLGDVGKAGPDKGKGGKFLILPPGESRKNYDSDKYYIFESNTYEAFLFLRSFFKDDTAPAAAKLRKVKIYPLNGSAKKMKYYNVSEVPSNSIAPKDWTYFELVDETIQKEPLAKKDQYMHGILASLGIKKGIEFNPSKEEKKMLSLASEVGWKMAKETALNFDEIGNKTVGYTTFWKDSPTWVAHYLTDEKGDQYASKSTPSYTAKDTGYTNVDAKMHMYINHYSTSDMMANAKIGVGAKYAGAYKDSNGDYLKGSSTYKITLPKGIPAELVWSVTAYDAETAAGLPSNNKYPSISGRDKPVKNPDGSITLWFGPKLPKGAHKENYLNTPAEKNWFSLLRLYGPEKSVFTGEWVPGEFEKIKN